jgi:DNA invertase Pin-like site-specific DNA recombinase
MMEYVGYIRVSTKRQGESGLGLEAQESIIRHYYPEVGVIYCDIKSGKNIKDRPELNKAIRYCKTVGATLVVAKVDRLSRNVQDGLWLLEQLGDKLRFCDLPGEVDKFIYTFFLSIGEREREIIRIRIKQALKAKKARGETWNEGNSVPRSAVIKSAEVRKRKAEMSKENRQAKLTAASLRVGGMSYEQIAKQLNEQSFASPTGGEWGKGSIYRLLNQ